MNTITRPLTADDLLKLPRGRQRYELLKGELHTMSPSGGEHGVVVVLVTARVERFVTAHQLGLLFGAETGFILESDPDTVRAADLGFVRKARIPRSGIPQGYWPGAPDLAVEVASPNDRLSEIDEKAADWLRAGAEAVWVLHPRWKTVAVYTPDGNVRTLTRTETLEGGALLPGFACCVAEFFWSDNERDPSEDPGPADEPPADAGR
ncbi:MAG: Uma2 family endonuclease [Planctomycetaceae bacterium]